MRQNATFSGEPAVAYTTAPNALHNWIAVRPMPLVPPWISTDSPAAKRMRSNRLYQTVKKFSGTQAASASDSPGGGGRQKPEGVVQYSA